MDSTLSAGLLERLDVLAAKMGVGATELWSLWLATAWRPMYESITGIIVGSLLLVGAALLCRFAIKHDREWAFGASVILGVVAGIVLLIGIIAAIIAVPYLIEPKLYALDQLKDLLP